MARIAFVLAFIAGILLPPMAYGQQTSPPDFLQYIAQVSLTETFEGEWLRKRSITNGPPEDVFLSYTGGLRIEPTEITQKGRLMVLKFQLPLNLGHGPINAPPILKKIFLQGQITLKADPIEGFHSQVILQEVKEGDLPSDIRSEALQVIQVLTDQAGKRFLNILTHPRIKVSQSSTKEVSNG